MGLNHELRALFDADRLDHRRGLAAGTPEYAAMRSRDAARRAAVARWAAAATGRPR